VGGRPSLPTKRQAAGFRPPVVLEARATHPRTGRLIGTVIQFRRRDRPVVLAGRIALLYRRAVTSEVRVRVRLTFLIGSVAALAISIIAVGHAAAAPPGGGSPISRPIPAVQQQTQSRTQTAHRGAPIIVDADRLIAHYDDIHDIHVTTDDSSYRFVPDSTPAGGIESDTDGDGIADDIYWEFSDGTWERVVDYDFDSDADALAIDVTADGFAEVQIWDNENGTYSVYQDSDGDAVFESEQLVTRSQLKDALPGVTDFLDIKFGPIGN